MTTATPIDSQTVYKVNDTLRVIPESNPSSPGMAMFEFSQDGYTERFIGPNELEALLRLFDGTRSLAEVRAVCRERFRDKVHFAERLMEFASAWCVPRGLLYDPDGGPAPARKRPRGYLYIKCQFLPSWFAMPIAQALAPLFRRTVAVSLGLMAIAAHVWFYFIFKGTSPIDPNGLGPDAVGLVGALTIVAALAHEFGHAAALAKYGGGSVAIGLGLYLYFPVLYTDVSDAWKLNRRHRAVVDLGGMYLQALTAALVIAAAALTRMPYYSYAVFLIDFSIAFSLNPFFRMDGYWLVADLFGIWNLREQSLQLLRAIPQYLHLRPRGVAPAPMRRFPIVLWIYTILSTAFFIQILMTVGYRTVYLLAPRYPGAVLDTVRIMRAAGWSMASASAAVSIGWKTMVMVGTGIIAWSLASGMFAAVKKVAATVLAVLPVRLASFVLGLAAGPLSILLHEGAHYLVAALLGFGSVRFLGDHVTYSGCQWLWGLVHAGKMIEASRVYPLAGALAVELAGPLASLLAVVGAAFWGVKLLGREGSFWLCMAVASCVRLGAPVVSLLKSMTWSVDRAAYVPTGTDEANIFAGIGIPFSSGVCVELLLFAAGFALVWRWARTRSNLLPLLSGVAAGIPAYLYVVSLLNG